MRDDVKVVRDNNIDISSLFGSSIDDDQIEEKKIEDEPKDIKSNTSTSSDDNKKLSPLEELLELRRTNPEMSGALVTDNVYNSASGGKKNPLISSAVDGMNSNFEEMDAINKKITLARKQGLIKALPESDTDLNVFIDEIDSLVIVNDNGVERVVEPRYDSITDKGDVELAKMKGLDVSEVAIKRTTRFVADDDRPSITEVIRSRQSNTNNTNTVSDKIPVKEDILEETDPSTEPEIVGAPSEEEFAKLAERDANIKVIINKIIPEDSEATVSIDFNDDEKRIMESAKIIQFNELIDTKLKSVDIDDYDDISSFDDSFDDVISSGNLKLDNGPITLCPFPLSGFKAYIKSFRFSEIVAFATQLKDSADESITIDEMITNLHTLYDNLVQPSIPIKDFTDFTHKLSFNDMRMATWSGIVSTYPKINEISMKCNKCGNDYTIRYDVTKLINYDTLSDNYINKMKVLTEDESLVTDSLYQVSPTKKVKRIQMVGNKHLVIDFGVPSCADMLYDRLKVFENKDTYERVFEGLPLNVITQYYLNLMYVKAVHVEQTDGTFKHFRKMTDILKSVYYLAKQDDINVIFSINSKYAEDYDCLTFALPDNICPKCNNHSPKVEVNLDFLASSLASDRTRIATTVENISV